MPSLPSSLALTNIPASSEILSADHRNNYAAIQTAVNALIAALSGGNAGQVLTALSSSSVDYSGPVYANYTPTWTSSGTAPVIGNAVIVARYLQIGKMVHCYGIITFGSSSTFGTGNYSFALPVTAAANAVSAAAGGMARLYDSNVNNIMLPMAFCATTTTMQLVYGATYGGTNTLVGQTAPWTWAQSDIIIWDFTYEAA